MTHFENYFPSCLVGINSLMCLYDLLNWIGAIYDRLEFAAFKGVHRAKGAKLINEIRLVVYATSAKSSGYEVKTLAKQGT